MLIEMLGAAGIGKTFFLDKLAEKVENTISQNELYSDNLDILIQSIPSLYNYQTNIDNFISFCMDSIDNCSMSVMQKIMQK